MNPISHALIGGLAATLPKKITRQQRQWIAVASIIPDLDGVGIVAEIVSQNWVAPVTWFNDYHRVLGHNVLAAVVYACVACFVFRKLEGKPKFALWLLLSFHLHLLADLWVGASPEPWPIEYLFPFTSSYSWTWSGQLALNAWPNFVATALLIVASLYQAYKIGASPLGLLSQRADQELVKTLRSRMQAYEVLH